MPPSVHEALYPVPDNETERLNRLLELQILDTPPEPDFDKIVELAQRLFKTPIVLVSLVDKDRQWFKSVCGLDEVTETPREQAFCNYTISTADMFIVEDATKDPRFVNNPLVTGWPSIRFYAGVPLDMGGGLLGGSFCIIDTEPRTLSDDEKQMLRRLGEVTSLMLRHSENARIKGELSERLAAKQAILEEQAKNLQNQKRLLDKACEIAEMGAFEVDIETGDLRWTDGMFRLHGLEPGKPVDTIEQFYTPSGYRKLEALYRKQRADLQPFELEARMVRADGELRWIRLNSELVLKDGVPIARYGVKKDITAEKKGFETIKRMAERDPLTKLFNRASLIGHLEKTIAAKKPAALLLLDLDGFKDINDTFGHPAGDQCLLRIAARLKAAAGRPNFISRIGGDEFAMVIDSCTDEAEALAIANELKQITAQPLQWKDQSFQLTTSIGIAFAQTSCASVTDLMSQADLALYRSKNAGRNCAFVFSNEMKEESDRKIEIVSAMRGALERRELELFYQAKMSFSTGQLTGFEALLRWNRPDGTVLAPDAFRPALDDPRLSADIGAFVVNAALDQAAAWKRAGFAFGSIAINAGASQFRNASFGASILAGISKRNLDPGMIEIEVTEDVFLSRSGGGVLKSCAELRECGIGIAFDDFGTGFASLTHLLEFPMTALKIDRTFVNRLFSKAGTAEVIRAIVALGRSVGVTVVAEGVETIEQHDFLRAIGCDIAQGYLFHRPSRAGDVLETFGARPVAAFG